MPSSPLLSLAVRHRIGGLSLEVSCAITKPWTVLFAPSGAGKSTLLRIIAGLTRPNYGEVTWHHASQAIEILTDTTQKVFVAPHRRAIRYVGQQPALFPQLTALENVAFASHSPDSIGEAIDLCQIGDVTQKMPSMLSGGERQKVAIARALAAPRARILLLDEPFSGLDTAKREEIVSRLKPWLAARDIPVLQVTHDIGEVFALGAEVIRIEAGRVAAQGSVETVLTGEQEWMIRQLASKQAAKQP